jgi:aldehyde:ferredoxin oxidoreductase
MKEIIGTSNRVLEVNLTTREVTEFRVTEDERRTYLGGKGLGLKILYERLPPGIDPLGPDNMLIFMMGTLLGSGAPCTSRFAALTKSPLTGLIASSSCGGPLGMALKTAGYDGLVIAGQAEVPVVVEIDAHGATVRAAGDLWGKETHAAQAGLALGRGDGALVIGPAGEHQVWYANAASGSRFLGRGGFGAVMGGKRLKAIVARGRACRIVPHDPQGFGATRKLALDYINANPFTSQAYRQHGTLTNLAYCNEGGILPVRNFSGGSDPRAQALAGPVWQEKYATRPHACRTCPILCGHQGTHPGGERRKIPEYETTSLLGPNLEIFDTESITEWSARCDALGLDTISTGATLAYVMEAGERGLLETGLRFGSAQGVAETLEDVAHRRDFGDELANGTRWLAQKYGGAEFAIQVKGLELPGYDPRGAVGQGLAYATANRGGCHLSATPFAQEVFFDQLDPQTTRAKAEYVHFYNKLYAAINALQTCVFTAYAYVREPSWSPYVSPPAKRSFMQRFPNLAVSTLDISVYSRLYETITGIKLTPKALLEAGQRINTLERYMNTREGVTRADDTLPGRFLKEGRACDPQRHTVDLEPMLDRFYRIAGYDADGIPTPATLARLGIPAQPARERRAAAAETRALAAYREIRPGRKSFKTTAIKIAMFAIGRAWQTLYRFDECLQREVAGWPQGYKVMFKVLPHGPQLVMGKDARGRLRYDGSRYSEEDVDLVFFFKNVECAFVVFSAQMGAAQAHAEHRTSVKGDLRYGLSVIRSLNVVQTYIFPQRIARRTVKRPARIPVFRKHAYRLWTYLVGIPFGI